MDPLQLTHQPDLPIPEPDELMVVWGAHRTVVVVNGVTTKAQAADVLDSLAAAYRQSHLEENQ